MSLRTACTIFLFFSACAFPIYFTVAVGLFCVVWFRNYYELIPLWFLNDALYGAPLARFHGFPLVMTAAAAALVLTAAIVRKRVIDVGGGKKSYA